MVRAKGMAREAVPSICLTILPLLVVTHPNCFPGRMAHNGAAFMRLLFVHDRFGAMAGAEINLQLTAAELKKRGHAIGLLHGPPTGKGERAWSDLFPERFALAAENNFATTNQALETAVCCERSSIRECRWRGWCMITICTACEAINIFR
jgi:hypothetical protein